MMGDGAGLELETIAGMAYDPLSGVWRMSDNTGVNYIAYFQKSGLVTAPPPGASASAQQPAEPAAEAAAAAGPSADAGVKAAAGSQGSATVGAAAAGGRPQASRRVAPVVPVEPLSAGSP